MPRHALIGHTGFVGGNLLAQSPFEDCFNSKSIESIAGGNYDLVVCAGAPAVKWKANKEPEADKAAIDRLTACLGQARAAHVILISTVDVYPNPVGVDEWTPIEPAECQPYGRHRFELERFVTQHFAATIVRLPGLFGPGLKKNVIYDFLHKNAVDQIHSGSVFQFYDLSRLWSDIQVVRRADASLVNFATEPVSVRDVAREAFGIEFDGKGSGAPVRYDFQTRHADLWQRQGGYMMTQDEVLGSMRAFVAAERDRQEKG